MSIEGDQTMTDKEFGDQPAFPVGLDMPCTIPIGITIRQWLFGQLLAAGVPERDWESGLKMAIEFLNREKGSNETIR